MLACLTRVEKALLWRCTDGGWRHLELRAVLLQRLSGLCRPGAVTSLPAATPSADRQSFSAAVAGHLCHAPASSYPAA